eukprot:c12523_g1_i2.p1 GENE.c12523_g1_i2~~c12523_g1_i2.p1  ORF type:complete len:262 (-),score=61.58 c12523_g1_i2:212-958(-)
MTKTRFGFCVVLFAILATTTLVQEAECSEWVEPFPAVDGSWNEDLSLTPAEASKAKNENALPPFSVTTSSVSQDSVLLDSYGCLKTCDKICNKQSLEIAWQMAPTDASSLVVLLDRPSSTPPYFVHWLLSDLSSASAELVAGATESDSKLLGAREWPNSYRENGYAAPCGNIQNEYRLVVFAISSPRIDLTPYFAENPTALGNEIQHHLIASNEVIDVRVIKFSYPFIPVLEVSSSGGTTNATHFKFR